MPRQSLMVKGARGVIRMAPEFSSPRAFEHLSAFSHLWVIYVFHKRSTLHHPGEWSESITPPRIEAPERVGVFASRSPHRPNPIGLSVVKLEEVRVAGDGRVEIEVSGVDILDGSPVIDLKPYVPYADSVPEAGSGWIENEIERYPVEFTEEALASLPDPGTKALLMEVLEWDPRPRSQRQRDPVIAPTSVGKRFAFRFEKYDIHWEIAPGGVLRVMRILAL